MLLSEVKEVFLVILKKHHFTKKQNEHQIRPKRISSGSISEDTIQNTSCAIAGVNVISDNDPEVLHSSTQINNLTVGELTKVVSGILSDPSFINEITSIMSQQVTITMSKTIQEACQKSIEPDAKQIQDHDEIIKHLQSKMPVLENERRTNNNTSVDPAYVLITSVCQLVKIVK